MPPAAAAGGGGGVAGGGSDSGTGRGAGRGDRHSVTPRTTAGAPCCSRRRARHQHGRHGVYTGTAMPHHTRRVQIAGDDSVNTAAVFIAGLATNKASTVIRDPLLSVVNYHNLITTERKHEGQHPLTGQRAVNFSLLANQ